MPHLSSDPYSTGEALYALHQGAGRSTDDPAYQRGLRYLLKAQHADGSWRMESRLDSSLPVSPDYFNAGFPDGSRHQFISIMATEWAALAVLQAVAPRPGGAAKPPASPY